MTAPISVRAEITMPSIDARRMIADLRRLAAFGAYKTGVHRPTYSAPDVAARHWLAERMQDAELRPVIDGIGNVIGHSSVDGPRLRWPAKRRSSSRPGGRRLGLRVAAPEGYDPLAAEQAQPDPSCTTSRR